MREHRVNPVDAIWLNMDRVQNLMVIECVMFLDGPVDRARFDQVVQSRLIDAYPVFSRRPTVPRHRWAKSRWRDVRDFDFTDHVREVRLPAPGDAAALQEYVGRFLAEPLPRDRPLWDIHIVEGLDEGSAIYVRLHHALADGIALTQVLLSLTDATADGDGPDGGGTRHHGVGHLIEAARRAAPEVSLLLRPARMRAVVVAAIRTGLSGVGVLRKLLVTRNPESELAGVAGSHKRAVWSDPIDLQQIKDIAKASDATVNDVLVSALAGALERYQLDHPGGGDAVDIPTMIPVNLRPLHLPLPRELGNRFSLVLLLLPSGLATATERLAETKLRMDRIKRSPEPVITFAMIQGIGLLGRRLSRLLVTFFAGKASGVTTNVPGPREHRYLAGTRITSLLGWVPGSGDQTLGTCVFTYAGTVRVGFKTDTSVIPDPERILDAFHEEIEDLRQIPAATSGR